jgi:S-adenosylmethionine decarboxylase
MSYKPGLHILGEFHAPATLLQQSSSCKIFFDNLIATFALQKVGEVFHDFDNGGFTAVICLTESHLSIHTWPEFELATFDVFLSNYQKDNSEKVREIFKATVTFFEGAIIKQQEVVR